MTTKKESGGQGLGVPSVCSVVEAHGGFVQIESSVESSNNGTTFRLFLPVYSTAVDFEIAEAWREQHRQETLPILRDEIPDGTILLADDQPDNLTSLAMLLDLMILRDKKNASNFQAIKTVTNGQAAANVVQQNVGRVRVALLDMSMPGWDFFETVTAIRSADPKVRIMVLSGHRLETLPFGVEAKFLKPADVKSVVKQITENGFHN